MLCGCAASNQTYPKPQMNGAPPKSPAPRNVPKIPSIKRVRINGFVSSQRPLVFGRSEPRLDDHGWRLIVRPAARSKALPPSPPQQCQLGVVRTRGATDPEAVPGTAPVRLRRLWTAARNRQSLGYPILSPQYRQFAPSAPALSGPTPLRKRLPARNGSDRPPARNQLSLCARSRLYRLALPRRDLSSENAHGTFKRHAPRH